MRAIARGALLVSLLPVAPRATCASALVREMARDGVRLTLRSIQRDLECMPPRLVRCDMRTKPYRWSRPKPETAAR